MKKLKEMLKKQKNETIISILALLFIIVTVVGVTYAAFTYTGLGNRSNKVTTSTITMNYNEATNGITLTDAFPISDNDGKVLTGEGRTFTFTVTVTTGNNTPVGYEISAVKDKTSTLSNNDVRIYLEKSTSGGEGTYSQVLAPTGFTPLNATTEIGTPQGEMILHSDSTTTTRTDYYILRMWVSEDYDITEESKFFTIKVNVYGTDSHINTSGLSLNKTETTIEEAGTEVLTASQTPSYATPSNITWESSNTDVATVDSNGLVTAQNISGDSATTTITATDAAGHSATCVVTVVKPEASSVAITGASHTMELADEGQTDATMQLTATVSPSNASSTTKLVTWTSSDSSKATVSNTGLVTAKSAGTVTITATTANNKSNTYEITIDYQEVQSIDTTTQIDESQALLVGDEDLVLTASITPSNAKNAEVDWTVSDSDIATISSNDSGASGTSLKKGSNHIKKLGTSQTVRAKSIKVHIKAPGNFTITMTTQNGTSKTINLTSSYATADSISLSPSEVGDLPVGETVELTPSITPSYTHDKTVTWTSSDTSKATVSNGVVTGVAPGEVTITATINGHSATTSITVKKAHASSVSISPASATIYVGGPTLDLTGTISPVNPREDILTWESKNTSFATVVDNNNNTATVTPVAVGTTNVEASTSNGKKGSSSITVEYKTADSVTVNHDSISLVRGTSDSSTIIATVGPSYTHNKTINWTSSDATVATVSSTTTSGNAVTINALKAGTTTLTATNNGKSATVSVTVTKPAPTSITIDQGDNQLELDRGKTLTLTSTILPADSLSNAATYSSGTTSVATVNSSTGVVTGVASGTSTITAKVVNYTSLTDTISIKVQPSKAVSLSMPTSTSVTRLSSTSFEVSGLTSDNKNDARDMSSVVVTSSNKTVASNPSCTYNSSTYKWSCTVTGSATGSSTITASVGNVTKTMTLTVNAIVPTSVSIGNKPTSNQLTEGDIHTLSATVSPSNADNKTVSWTSSKTSVATIGSSTGKITAKSAGTTTIKVTTASGSKTASFTLTVKSAVTPVSQFSLGNYVNLTPSYSENYSCSTTGCSGSITPSELTTWRVITKNGDGTVDVVSEYTSSTKIRFTGEDGYKYFVQGLQDLASKYVNTAYTSGYRYMGYNEQTPIISGSLDTSNAGISSTPSSITPTGVGQEYKTGYQGDTLYAKDYNAVNSALGTLVTTDPSGTTAAYWLASRYYYYKSSYYYEWFGRYINVSGVLGDTSAGLRRYSGSTWYDYDISFKLRPILTLKSDIVATSGDGKSEETAWSFGS